MARAALATLEAAGDDWGVSAAALMRALAAALGGDVATVAEMAAVARSHADAIGYDAFRVPALLLEAWVVERRREPRRRRRRTGAPRSSRGVSGSTTTPRSPWPSGVARVHRR